MTHCANLNQKTKYGIACSGIVCCGQLDFGFSQPPSQVMHASQCLTVFMDGSGSDVILC